MITFPFSVWVPNFSGVPFAYADTTVFLSGSAAADVVEEDDATFSSVSGGGESAVVVVVAASGCANPTGTEQG